MLGSLMRLGLQTLATRWRVALMMALIIALPLTGVLLLEAYRTGLANILSGFRNDLLVVQASGSMGEFYGSRLPYTLADELKARGARLIVPEIHTFTGTSGANTLLLRGISLAQYTRIVDFHLLAGRSLQLGDAPRLAMLGSQLAGWRHVTVGDSTEIRGRQFQVIGIFSTETVADYEAWISLSDAQTLLGWNDDVSVFVVEAGEGLQAGDQLPFGASVVQKGTTSRDIFKDWLPLYDFLKPITLTLGMAAVVTLANLLWRLAWMRRHELAILRSLGFSRGAVAFYLMAQAGVISLGGYVIGCLVAFIIVAVTETRLSGIMEKATMHAEFSAQVLAASLVFTTLITLLGSVLPVWQISHLNLTALLRDE
jgi:ABC-type lipoprotein release transport system permease subunit